MNFFRKNNEKKVVKASKNDIKPISIEDDPYVVAAQHIYSNDYLRIVANACSVCWDKKPPISTEDRVNYIAKRVKTGHTSILEHSNIIMAVTAIDSDRNVNDVIKFISAAQYLHTKYYKKDDKFYLLVGGSLRGYFDVFNKLITHTSRNLVVDAIINEMYKHSYRGLFEHYIEAGMIQDMFESYDFVDKANSAYFNISYRTESVESNYKFEIVGYDSIYLIHKWIFYNISTDIAKEDLLEFCTISVLFKNMSRTATHQLVRHRNAITQESQRYVDYSNANFVSPSRYNEKIDNTHYAFKFGDQEFVMTLEDLGDNLCNIYEYLIKPDDKFSTPLRREEARAFLPSNVACKRLYMTFNILSFFKFIELRTDKAAQAEIRDYAVELKDWYEYFVKSNYSSNFFDIPYDTKYLYPVYISENTASYDEVDEPIE